MKKIFYEKVGRRYVPVREYDSELMDSFPEGTHLVVVQPGEYSTRYNVNPDLAPMIAAGRYAEKAISVRIMETSALRCPEDRKPITEEQRAAWEAFNRAMGDERYPLEYCSYREAAEAGVAAMQQEADKLLKNPAVKAAYNEFMLLCELARTNEDKK